LKNNLSNKPLTEAYVRGALPNFSAPAAFHEDMREDAKIPTPATARHAPSADLDVGTSPCSQKDMGREYNGARLVRVMRTPISMRNSAKVPRTDAVTVVSVTARHSRPHSLPSALSQ
jgi:hypothetical protein